MGYGVGGELVLCLGKRTITGDVTSPSAQCDSFSTQVYIQLPACMYL